MEKKESFLNLMQEQKQICEKCYLWDNDGCYCASDGRNTEVCEFFNRIDALYSDPPSPEMVCPHCEGSGKFYADGKVHYAYEHISTIACAYCNGTGKVPSPESLEKVGEEILDDEAIMEAIDDADEDYKVNHLSRRFDEFEENQMQNNRYTFVLKAQILKLQQAGWGDTTALKTYYEQLFDESTKAQAEAILKIVQNVKAEARQQALKEVGEWLSKKVFCCKEHCCYEYDRACESLKQGELPKE